MRIKDFIISQGAPLTIITGPCVIESEDHVLRCAEHLKKLLSNFPVSFIFKASFDKANRSSIQSYRGVGLDKGLRILQRVKEELDLPVTSDIHLPEEAEAVKDVLDLIQIPAFLCRQTDLLVAAAKTNLPINVKKGQFVSPWDMENVVQKIRSSGNDQIMLTDRGTSFGYNNLVSDMRAIPVMKKMGVPVCFDASHSVQLPGGLGEISGGQREFIPTLSKAAIAAGANALFIETHPEPEKALSDSASQMSFEAFETLLNELVPIYEACTKKPNRLASSC